MAPAERFDYSSVPEHAEQLRIYADAIRVLSKEHTRTGLLIGEHLLSAKAKLKHGQFQHWCDTELGMQARSAENYMNVAALFRSLQERGEESALHQMVWSAAIELASPTANEATVAEVLGRVSRGERLKVKEVKDRVSQTRKRKSKSRSDGPPPGVDALAAAVDVTVKKLVLKYLGEKPTKEDANFLKWLRLRFANDVREGECGKTPMMMVDWAAA